MLELKSRPALIIIDMQNCFCHPNGTFGKLNMSIENHMKIVPNINRLRQQAHASDVPIFFIRYSLAPDYSNAGILLDDHPEIKAMNGLVEGSWDADIIDELRPTTNEIVIDKTRNTAFWKTTLTNHLEESRVDQLIVTGVGTNVCVESTVRDAMANGVYCKTVTDGTATLSVAEHEASLKTLEWFGGVTSADEVIDAFQAKANAKRGGNPE